MVHFLSQANLGRVPRDVKRPAYDRRSVDIGIVHFGPGAFHRAHQAWFVEKLLADDDRWSICGVSLRNPDVRDALAKPVIPSRLLRAVRMCIGAADDRDQARGCA